MNESLLAAIAANPSDDIPRLVYADWLEEHGNDGAASAVRIACGKGLGVGRWRDTTLDLLVGRVITGVTLADDATLVVTTKDGSTALAVEGDCCSTSWYYRVRGVAQIIGQPALAVVEVDTSDVNLDDGLGRQESDSVYGIGILTPAGVLEITYRNSSNGYYGGWMEAAKGTVPEGGKPITEDWTYTTERDSAH